MYIKTKQIIFASAMIAATSVVAESNPEMSEEEIKEGYSFNEIIITARKREERLQDTPIAVTAIEGDLLEELGVVDLTGITALTPNVSFSTTGTVSGSTSSAVVYIRGIGQNDYVPVVDPGVGIYVDDVYLGRTVGSVLDLADIERIEVVRGPQGTLFGRNTIGGAISITTNSPEGDTEGKFRVVYGDQGRREVFGTVMGELADDVGGLFTFMNRQRDGTVTRVNVPGSKKLGNDNMQGIRFKLNVDSIDKWNFTLIGDAVKEREESAPEVNAFFQDSLTLPGAWNGFNGFAAFAPGSTASGCIAGDTSAGQNCYNESLQLGPFATGETSLSQNDLDTWGISLASTYEFNDEWSAKLIVATRELKADFARQVDGSSLNLFENRESYDSEQTSVDFRINGALDLWSWVTGFFYYEETSDNQLDFDGVLNSTLYPIHFGGITDNSNYAVYGEGSYNFTEALQLSIGLRYTDEEKNATPNAFAYPGCSIDTRPTSPSADCDSTVAPVAIPRRAVGTTGYLIDPVKNTINFDEITWRVNLSYDVNDDTMIYGLISTGFKSGGFEWRVTNTSFTTPEAQAFIALGSGSCGEGNECLPTFDPETVTTYEFGIKSQLSEEIRLNTAIFYSDFEDMIVAANQGGIATFQTNAARSTIQGIESELTWIPTENWLINASIGYIDAEYKEVSPEAQAAGITTEDSFVFTPKTSVSIGLSYNYDLSDGAYLTARLDGVNRSEQEFEAANSIYTREDGYTAFNTAIKYTSAEENWDVSLGIENLTDELYKVGGDANGAIGYENVIFARPRNYYLAVNYLF